jgi:hypothetical protein
MILKNSMKQDQCDRDTIIFNKGFESGQQHQHSSPETVKAIGDLKEKIDKIYFCLFGIAEDEQSDNRWYCKECYLHCVRTSETNPIVCKEEDETPSKLEAHSSVRSQSV